MENKTLIAYFSREGDNYLAGKIVNLPVGNTEIAAKNIAELTGGDLFKIERVTPYSGDYKTCVEEAKEEIRGNARPELIAYPENFQDYTLIILGYPNWCGTMPMPVWTFLEKFNFSEKTILPFCTNEGSGMGVSERDIRKLCPQADVKNGLSIRGGNVQHAGKEIAEWLKQNGRI